MTKRPDSLKVDDTIMICRRHGTMMAQCLEKEREEDCLPEMHRILNMAPLRHAPDGSGLIQSFESVRVFVK